MLAINELIGFAASAARPLSVSYVSNYMNSVDLSTYTWADCNVGVGDEDWLVVAAHYRGGGSIDGVTVNGVSAARCTAPNSGAELWIVKHPKSATATIVVTGSGGAAARAGIGVWTLKGDLASSVPTDTLATASGSISVAAGGVVIGYGTDITNNLNTCTGITEEFDVPGENTSHIGGSYAASSDLVLAVTMSQPDAAYASWV